MGLFAVGYNTNADSLTSAVPVWSRYDRPLLLPFLGCLYLTIAAAQTIAQTEMTVYILGAGQAHQGGQLLNIAGFSAAVINLDAVPAGRRLSGPRLDSLSERVEPIVA